MLHISAFGAADPLTYVFGLDTTEPWIIRGKHAANNLQ